MNKIPKLRPPLGKALRRGLGVADRALSVVSDAAANAWVDGILSLPNLIGRISAAAQNTGAAARGILKFLRVLLLTVTVIAGLDWATKLAVNAVIPPAPNAPNFVPMDPRDYPGRFFPLAGDGAFAITHVEHAFTSANDRWLDSPYGSPALDTQAWLLERVYIEFDLWVVALGILTIGTLAVAVIVGTLLRMRPLLIAILSGVYLGGSIGNNVELGFFGDITDWIWFSKGDWEIIFNLADVAIVVSPLVYFIRSFRMMLDPIFGFPIWKTRRRRKARPPASKDDAGPGDDSAA